MENRKVENYNGYGTVLCAYGCGIQRLHDRGINLQEVAQQVLLQNKYYLIQSHVKAEVACPIRYTAIRNGSLLF